MASGVKSICVLAAALMAAGCASLNVASDGATRASGGDLKTPAASAQAPAVDVQVVTAQFGVFGADPAGRRLLYETDKFPAIPAAPYGWYILFKTEQAHRRLARRIRVARGASYVGSGRGDGNFQYFA